MNTANIHVKAMLAGVGNKWLQHSHRLRLPDGEIIDGITKDDILHANAAADTRIMMERMTLKEQMGVCFVPQVISELAWEYADRVTEYCTENRLDEYKTQTRCIKELKHVYHSEIARDLNIKGVNHIAQSALEFKEECARDLNIFFFSVKQDFDRQYPDEPHNTMRTNALLCIMILQFLYCHNENMNRMLKQKVADGLGSITNPMMVQLGKLMRFYSPMISEMEFSQHVKTCIDIMAKNFDNINYQLEQ